MRVIIRSMLAAGLLIAVALPAYASEASISLAGKVTGLADGTLNVAAPAFTKTSPLGVRTVISLSGTATTSLSVPATATAMLIVPANTSTISLSLFPSAAVATPINLGITKFAFLPLVAGQAPSASASATVDLYVTFF